MKYATVAHNMTTQKIDKTHTYMEMLSLGMQTKGNFCIRDHSHLFEYEWKSSLAERMNNTCILR